METFDLLVRGAGIVGRSLALSASRLGLRVGLQPGPSPAPAGDDIRAYALNAASVSLLRRLKVWDALPPHAATPVHDMHIEGDRAGAALHFSAWEQRVSELAWIVDAGLLEHELATAVKFAPHVSLAADDAQAPLTALCEGRDSASRAALGVAMNDAPYGHRAIAARLTASEDHRNTARQWFRSPDVLALLPFETAGAEWPHRAYGLVWSLPDAQADALMALDDAGFEAALADATGGAAGTLRLSSVRRAWPLRLARAEAWCGPGWVLLGDAAHVVHPLAGQGLNLGLADVAALETVIAAREPWRPLGDERLLRRYVRARLEPTWAMGQVTDGLLHLFAREQPALRELRNAGLTLVNRLKPVKRWLAARALES